MIALGIVGSRSLTPSEYKESELIVDMFINDMSRWFDVRIVSGGAEGVDTIAAWVAHKHGLYMTVHRPTVFTWAEPGGFRDRNIKIIEESDMILAVTSASSKSFGTGWTIHEAIRQNKKVSHRKV